MSINSDLFENLMNHTVDNPPKFTLHLNDKDYLLVDVSIETSTRR